MDVYVWIVSVEILCFVWVRPMRIALLRLQVDEGGGAFYGPKIDLKIRDAIGRTWQCSTVQADFNLPDRFNLEYIDRYTGSR